MVVVTRGGEETGKQLREWEGAFGRAYTDRNLVQWQTRLPLFRLMLEGLHLGHVLEVGCNRGHNLVALAELLGSDAELVGVEPNEYARTLAKSANPRATIISGSAEDLPLGDAAFDLVFTWGVLIHIPLRDLPRAISEIHRVTSRYILAVEYFAETETAIHYRGHDDLLWKRDFGKHFLEGFPDLNLMRQGYWGPEQGADRVTWWLFERRDRATPAGQTAPP